MAAGSSSLSWHYQIQALSPCEWFIVVFYYYLVSRRRKGTPIIVNHAFSPLSSSMALLTRSDCPVMRFCKNLSPPSVTDILLIVVGNYGLWARTAGGGIDWKGFEGWLLHDCWEGNIGWMNPFRMVILSLVGGGVVDGIIVWSSADPWGDIIFVRFVNRLGGEGTGIIVNHVILPVVVICGV
jgi:hypothetical protein